ncbi:MAG: hypothetical protein HY895_06330 [Deltaproteobacteria bacterium]|nr:hypothetical protein [Deltaproteobacteria bacterium]
MPDPVRPAVLDFSSYIAEKTGNFTGRTWVFDAVSKWLQQSRHRIFLLTGGPGTGKSAIAARLVQMSQGLATQDAHPGLGAGWLSYYHFCQAGHESSLSPLTFVQSLSEALANHFTAFRTALESIGSRQIVLNTVMDVGTVQAGGQAIGAQIRVEIKSGDARPMFDMAVRRPLQTIYREAPADPIVILVDSLDEALAFNAETNITQLLKLTSDFPPQVRFFFTCRSNSVRVFDVIGPATLDLIADAPPALDEVKLYAVARLNAVPEPARSDTAERIARKSNGNFLYAYHVLNDLIRQNIAIGDPETLDLPDELEDVYRKAIEREMASNPARWAEVFRPILGSIAVALGNGLTREQLTSISGLAEDTAADVLETCAQYLEYGDREELPYRFYHQSFREFLLHDTKYPIYPAERHAAIARFFQDRHGKSWATCTDDYALRYTPVHWAEAAALSETKRDARVQAMIGLTGNLNYRQRFEKRIKDLPMLHGHVYRTVQVAALSEANDLLPWLIKAAKDFVSFRRDYVRAESVVAMVEEGRIEDAERRLPLFADVDEDWQVAARLILAWLGSGRNRSAAEQLRDRVVQGMPLLAPLPLLRDRLNAALGRQDLYPFEAVAPLSLEVGQELVKRISGQEFNRELLGSVNPSLITRLGAQSEMIAQRGYAASFDAPILVNMAREVKPEGTVLLDEYVQAHAGYNYVEYRNRSLWLVLHAVLRHHPDQDWVRERLRKILVAALSGGGVDFEEMLPMTAAGLLERVRTGDARPTLDLWRNAAMQAADALQNRRGANDSWGTHKRRLATLMELHRLILGDADGARKLMLRIDGLPGGFAGFQAPALLRYADALRTAGMADAGGLDPAVEHALKSAHHIQDYHFCARVTARCNALQDWHHRDLKGQDLADTIRRLARSPSAAEFAATHVIHEPYRYRDDNDPDTLPIHQARQAETIEQLVEVFQMPAVEFRRLNPQHSLTEKLGDRTAVLVPDPGLVPLLAVHLASRALADADLDEERTPLIRSLVPAAAINPTALDTVLSYMLVAAAPDDPDLLEVLAREAGPVDFVDTAAPKIQVGPDSAMPA